MVPIVAVVGPTNSGKTTLIEKLIPALSARGYHLASLRVVPATGPHHLRARRARGAAATGG